MNKPLICAAGIAMMAPGAAMAAVDGTTGTRSSGRFGASTHVQPPASATVVVIGLGDFLFGTVNTRNTGTASVQGISQPFLLKRSDVGNVLVTSRQMDNPPGDGTFCMSKDATTYLPFAINMFDTGGEEIMVARGVQFPTPRSADGCDEANAANPSTGHSIKLTSAPIAVGTAEGLYSTTIQITIASAG